MVLDKYRSTRLVPRQRHLDRKTRAQRRMLLLAQPLLTMQEARLINFKHSTAIAEAAKLAREKTALQQAA